MRGPTRAWMRDCTAIFLAALDELADEAYDAPTALPGWTRKHLVAHVHYNAEALRRLASWARTGEESRMYAGPEQRASEIAAGARLPAAELRTLVHESAQALAHDLDGLTEEQRNREVVTAQGRTVPASEISWMRTREVAVHAVDLGSGTTFADLPDDVVTALAIDAATKHAAGPAAAQLTAWLTGRSTTPPTLRRWL